jgi:RNA 3'-terminal phosphate cyclase
MNANNQVVADLLRDNGFSIAPRSMRITSEPQGGGRVATTIRNLRSAESPWTATAAANLAHVAGQLPGADVRLRPVVDRVVVVWDGV